LSRVFRIPSTFRELVAYILAAWLSVALVALVLSLVSTIAKVVGAILFLVATGGMLQQVWKLLRARQAVLVEKDVPLLWGLVRLVAWDPIEGVLFLENKGLGFSDDDLHDCRGGVRFIYPVLGEELALRVPLEVQTLRFADEHVMTREYLSVTARGTMKWRIVDIRKFYLLVSRELRSIEDHGDVVRQSPSSRVGTLGTRDGASNISDMMRLSVEWLRVLAEEQTRVAVSRISSGLLIADRLNAEFPEVGPRHRAEAGVAPLQTSSPEWTATADSLAGQIHQTISARVGAYGITIDEVSLQELRLPEEIVQECVRACKAAYLPLLAQRETAMKRAELAVEVDLLGREAVSTRQIVGAAPALTLSDFLNQFLIKRLGEHNGTGLGAGLAAIAAGQAVAALPHPHSAADKGSPTPAQ
jgi:regulator of protease activity HflC (stomatin/prohibitin superfamily)